MTNTLEKIDQRLERMEERLKAIEAKWEGGKLAASVIKWLIGLGVSITAIVGYFHAPGK